MKPLSSWWRRRARAERALAEILATVTETKLRLDATERLLRRIQRDTERVKLQTGLVLGADRALALLASGDRIFVDPRDGGVGLNLLSEGRYEEDEVRLFRRFLRPGAHVLDIGANYGIYSITAAPYVRPGGWIMAFEPNPHVCGLLTSSIYLNGFLDVVDPRRLGASGRNGELRFEINEASPGGAHILAPGEVPPAHHLVIDVAVARIDDRIGADTVIDLVKIDVEGHEESVLRGMQATIARSPDITIFMELFYPLFRSDEDFIRLLDFVTGDLGLIVNLVLPGGTTRQTDAAELRGRTCNLILSRKPLAPRPDLTIHPVQLIAGKDARLTGGALEWVSTGDGAAGGQAIAHGPYLHLPRGAYRMVLDADFEGMFTCRIMENYGDILWQQRIGPGAGHAADVYLNSDAPKLEVGFWSGSPDRSRMVLRRIEFWPI